MHALPLAPLPCESSDESLTFRRMDEDGFVDERVVSRVIARGAYERTHAEPAGMALSSNGDDYAGWPQQIASPFRMSAETTPASNRLPSPPALRKYPEPGMDAPYEGGHRWWLFGMSGLLTCSILALTILSLTDHKSHLPMPASAPVTQQGKAPAPSTEKTASQPALTTVLPVGR